MALEVRMLDEDDFGTLSRVAPDVFDHPIRPDLAMQFLSDPRHHMAAAIDDGILVGFASGVHYVHPDKPAELFVNEVGVSPSRRNQGVGTSLLECLLSHARTLGCESAWVLTGHDNHSARRMYAKAGGLEAPPQRMISFDLRQAR